MSFLQWQDSTQGASSSSRKSKKKGNDTVSIPSVPHSGVINEEAEIEFQTEVGTQQSQLSVYSTTQPHGPEVGTEEDPSLRPIVVLQEIDKAEREKEQT